MNDDPRARRVGVGKAIRVYEHCTDHQNYCPYAREACVPSSRPQEETQAPAQRARQDNQNYALKVLAQTIIETGPRYHLKKRFQFETAKRAEKGTPKAQPSQCHKIYRWKFSDEGYYTTSTCGLRRPLTFLILEITIAEKRPARACRQDKTYTCVAFFQRAQKRVFDALRCKCLVVNFRTQ